MNKVMLMGRLTKEVEIRYSQSGTAVCSFTLAVDRRFKKEGEEQQADFIMCKAFGKTAEFCNNYYSKGQKVAVSGRIQTGSYEKEGQRVYTTDVIVEEAFFAEGKKDKGDAHEEAPSNNAGFFPVDNNDDELPF